MTNAQQQERDFPDFNENEEGKANSEKPKKPFTNQLFPNDSLMVCDGFINDIRDHTKDGRTMYFVSVGLLQGSVKVGDEFKGDITNCDLLAGSTLEKWFQSFNGSADSFKGIRFKMEIRNLKFSPKIHEGKPYLDSRGILETLKIGRLD